MTEEEKAEEYLKDICPICNNREMYRQDGCATKRAYEIQNSVNNDIITMLQAQLPQWHDLRKNPDDLPKEGIEVLVLYSNTYDGNGLVVDKYALRYELAKYINDEEDVTEWYWVEARTDDMVHEVIAWCELPKYEEK